MFVGLQDFQRLSHQDLPTLSQTISTWTSKLRCWTVSSQLHDPPSRLDDIVDTCDAFENMSTQDHRIPIALNCCLTPKTSPGGLSVQRHEEDTETCVTVVSTHAVHVRNGPQRHVEAHRFPVGNPVVAVPTLCTLVCAVRVRSWLA